MRHGALPILQRRSARFRHLRPSTASTSTSPRASSSPSSARRAPARPRCCACWPAWRRRRRRHSAARQAHQRRAGQPAADLHGVPVAGAVPAPHGRREHRVPAEDPRIDPADAQGARARADGASCACRRTYYGKSVHEMLGRRAPARGTGPRAGFDPEILFFDEPLSAIDYKLRKTLEKELKDIHRETGKTFVYITHSLEEAMVMSDRIGVMRGWAARSGRHAAGDLSARPTQVRLRVHGRRQRLPVTLNGGAGAHSPSVVSSELRAADAAGRLSRRATW